MKAWDELLGSIQAPYDIQLGLEPGTRFPARPPYPDLAVLEVDNVHVRQIVLQRMVVEATTPEDAGVASEPRKTYEVLRLVALLEGGAEMEIHRTAVEVKGTDDRPIDPTRCAACNRPIPYGEGVTVDGRAYHQRCVDAPRGHVPRRRLEEL